MDVVGSSFAVVSLSIQIADSVKKLSSFLGSALGAPRYVRRLIDELDIFQGVLEMIAHDIEEAPLPASNIEPIRRCLVTCNERVQNILSMVNDLEQALSQGGRRMRWASLKTAFKKEKIAEFHAELESAKHVLSMAVQSLSYRVQRSDAMIMHHTMQLVMKTSSCPTLSPGSSALLEATTPRNSTSSADDGPSSGVKAPIESTTCQAREPLLRRQWCSSKQYHLTPYHLLRRTMQCLPRSVLLRHRNKIQKFLASLSSTSGLTYYSTRSWVKLLVHGESSQDSVAQYTECRVVWRFVVPFWQRGYVINWVPRSITVHRIVPNDSPIFDLCERGNLQGVMLAFAEGWANPHDTTPCGWTPLHAAIAFGHVRICELLLEYGVDGTNCVNYRDPFDILYGYTVNTCMQLRTDRPNSHTFTIFKALVKYGFDPVEPRGILGSTCFNGRWDPEIYTWLIDQEYVYIDFEQLNGDIFVEPPLMSLLGKSISSSAGQRLINRLLQVGVDVHAHRSSRTALDVAITENIVENWLQLLSHSGYDLRAYLLREQEIHGKEHVHKEFRCFPSLGGSLHHRSLVRYHYGATGDQCRISLVDYDAIDWFFAGFFDLDIFSDSNTVTCNACDESFDSNGVRHYFCAEFDRVGDMAIVCFECMNSPIWSIIYYPDVGNQFVLVDHTRQTEETHEGVSNTATGEQSRDIFRVSRTLVEALRLESTAAALASSVNLRWIYGLSVLFLIWHFSLKLVLFAIAAAYTVQLGLIWKGLKTGLTMEHEPKGGSRKTRRQRRRANRRKSRGTP